jgi:hypothetical protein
MLSNPAPSSPGGLDASGDLESFPDLGTPAGAIFRHLRGAGLTDAQAGDLTARATGLRITSRPWRLQEIQGLLFLRSLVDGDRLEP